MGKKNDLIKELFTIHLEEWKIAERKAELQSLNVESLKKLAMKQGLPIAGKERIVESLLSKEAEVREAIAAHERRLQEVLAKKKEDLARKSGTELKELCVSKGLKAGISTEDSLERLLEEAKAS